LFTEKLNQIFENPDNINEQVGLFEVKYSSPDLVGLIEYLYGYYKYKGIKFRNFPLFVECNSLNMTLSFYSKIHQISDNLDNEIRKLIYKQNLKAKSEIMSINILPICLLEEISSIIVNKSNYKYLAVEIVDNNIKVYSTDPYINKDDQDNIDYVNAILSTREFIMGKQRIKQLILAFPTNYNILNNIELIKTFDSNEFALN
jgi:hypothetical protein